MKKTKLIILLTLLIVFISIIIYWIFTIHIQKQKTTAAINFVKQKIDHYPEDLFRGCVYDKNYILISLNHHDYFIINNDEVRIFNKINEKTKNKFPNIPLDDEFMDIYWVLENCR